MLTWDDIAIEAEWIDYNGHLNMAAYLVVFDRAMDRLIDTVGLSSAPGTDPTIFAASAKIDYLREVAAEERPSCVTGVIALDSKRLHTFQELRVGGEARARAENLHVHVERTGPRAAPFSRAVREALEAMIEPAPDWIGRPVADRLSRRGACA